MPFPPHSCVFSLDQSFSYCSAKSGLHLGCFHESGEFVFRTPYKLLCMRNSSALEVLHRHLKLSSSQLETAVRSTGMIRPLAHSFQLEALWLLSHLPSIQHNPLLSLLRDADSKFNLICYLANAFGLFPVILPFTRTRRPLSRSSRHL